MSPADAAPRDLPPYLTDVLRAHGAFCIAAAPFFDDTVQVPHAELEHLGRSMLSLEAALSVALQETRKEHRKVTARYAQEPRP